MKKQFKKFKKNLLKEMLLNSTFKEKLGNKLYYIEHPKLSTFIINEDFKIVHDFSLKLSQIEFNNMITQLFLKELKIDSTKDKWYQSKRIFVQNYIEFLQIQKRK